MDGGGPQSFQIAMTNCCAVAVALFGGYFLAAYAINEMGVRMFGMPANAPLTQQFAGYALVVPFLLQIVTGLYLILELLPGYFSSTLSM